MRSNLSILSRVGYYQSGLLTPSQIEGLISDALTSNMMHWLPDELIEYAKKLRARGKLHFETEAN